MSTTIQDIHKELMDKINATYNEALDKIEQIDPSQEKYSLQMVMDLTIYTRDPSAPFGQRVMLKGETLLGNRSTIAMAAANLAAVAGIAPATVPNPDGYIGLDEFVVSNISEAATPTNMFSAN